MKREPWDEKRVREMLATHRFHYQKIPLPYGLQTGGKDRSSTANRIFPADLAGKSVFDLGCMNGYFTFEAERRGAAPVVGGEIDPENVATCKMLADCLGSNASFLQFDVELDPLPSSFDYVLCLNVLHHLRNPLSALEKIANAAREYLILEVASLAPGDARKLGPAVLALSPLIKSLPVIYLGGAGKEGGASQSFFLTESAVLALLKKHRQDFASVDILGGGQKGRFIAIARKRKIGHLHIIAGVNAVGKSTMLDSFAAGKNLQIAERLGLLPLSDWKHQNYGKLPASTEPNFPRMLLQYNISKHLIDGDLHQHDRGLLDVIRCADRVTVTTLWHPAPELYKRYAGERVGPAGITRVIPRNRKKADKLLRLFKDRNLLDSLYTDWSDFISRNALEHKFVLQMPEYRICSPEEWRAIVSRQV